MFKLEDAIKKWKRTLRGNPGFEDGDVAELEAHLRDRISFLTEEGMEEKQAFRQAVEEIGDVNELGNELHKTVARKPYPASSGLLSWGILANYQKIARRSLVRNKLYSLINIFGLSIGITCCLLIYIFIQNELNYDKFHQNKDRIYHVLRMVEDEAGDMRKVGITSVPFRSALENDFPGMIEKATHLMPSDAVVTIEDRKFREDDFYFADANYFSVFSFPFIYGDPETALNQPNAVVLSEETARKYFDDENPVGKTIRADDQFDFEVTGVFTIPDGQNSHTHFDLAGSIETFRNSNFYTGWWWNQVHTYVLLSPDADKETLEANLPGFMDKYFGENMRQNNRRIGLSLQPLEEIYFANDVTFDWEVKKGSRSVIYLFGIIALLIIIVACVNFVNMATARSVSRAKEIGVRKTLGARRGNLMIQFLGEGVMISLLSGLISFALAWSLIPWFTQLVGKEIVTGIFSAEVIFAALALTVIIGLASGLYPSVYLSSFQPVKALKEKISFGSSQLFVRKGLIVFQFAISSLLIISTLIIHSQMNYVSDRSLGFQPDKLLNISINNGDIREHLDTFQQEIEQLPGVEVSGVMSGTPGGFFDNYLFRAGENWDQTYTLNTLYTDYNFKEVLDLNMLAGRDFDESYRTDPEQAVVINKEAADMFGWTPEEALGKRFENQYRDSVPRTVIGVVENFHFSSLHEPIAPLVVSMIQDRREILVKVQTDNIGNTLTSIEDIWNKYSPLYPVEQFFLDQQFAQLYESDRRQQKVFMAFSVIAVFIACLGLFSLAAFNAEKRRKEMGIRKILGASFSNLLLLFNKEVLTVVTISFLIAVPVGWYLAEQWLQEYAYHIPNSAGAYLLAGGIILALAVLTVSYQSLKIALQNPVKNLKNE